MRKNHQQHTYPLGKGIPKETARGMSSGARKALGAVQKAKTRTQALNLEAKLTREHADGAPVRRERGV